MSSKTLISNNIKYNAIGQTIAFAVNFVLFPLVVSRVGNEVYGAYALVMTFNGYIGMLEFGVGGALIKYVAEFLGAGDREKAHKVISASFSFYVGVGIVAAVMLVALSFVFQYLFRVEPANIPVIRQLCWIAAGAALLIWPARTFLSTIQALQRFAWLALFNGGAAILTLIATYIVLTAGGGIVHFIIIALSAQILMFLACLIASLHLLKMKITFPCFDKETYKTIFSFSLFVFLGSLAAVVAFDLGSFVVGAFVSVASVTLYRVAYNLQAALRTVNSTIGATTLPACADLEGRKDYDKQRMLLLKGTKYITMVFTPMVLIAVILAGPLIRNWMGNGFDESILPARIFMALWLFNGTIDLGLNILTAKGYVRAIFNFMALTAITNLVLSLILVRYLGILGVTLAITAPMVLVNFALVLRKFLKVMNISLSEFFNASIKDNLRVFVFTVILSVIALIALHPNSIILMFLEMGVLYGISLLFGFLIISSPEERREILTMVRFR